MRWKADYGPYLLQVSDKKDFSSILFEKKVSETEYSYKALKDGVYYWRVATLIKGHRKYSEVSQFILSPEPVLKGDTFQKLPSPFYFCTQKNKQYLAAYTSETVWTALIAGEKLFICTEDDLVKIVDSDLYAKQLKTKLIAKKTVIPERKKKKESLYYDKIDLFLMTGAGGITQKNSKADISSSQVMPVGHVFEIQKRHGSSSYFSADLTAFYFRPLYSQRYDKEFQVKPEINSLISFNRKYQAFKSDIDLFVGHEFDRLSFLDGENLSVNDIRISTHNFYSVALGAKKAFSPFKTNFDVKFRITNSILSSEKSSRLLKLAGDLDIDLKNSYISDLRFLVIWRRVQISGIDDIMINRYGLGIGKRF